MRNLLDECYRQTTAGFVDGEISILLHLGLDIGGFPRSLREIEAISNNTPDRQRLRKFVQEHSSLINTHHTMADDRLSVAGHRHVLRYSISRWLCDFAFDPNRSRNLYSTSLVTSECQRAIGAFIAKNSVFWPHQLNQFFVQDDEVSDASRLLEHAKDGSDRNDLLLFLRYLSKIHWLDIYPRGWNEGHFTHGIVQWVCTTLVS